MLYSSVFPAHMRSITWICTLLLRRLTKIAAVYTLLITIGLFGGGVYVYALENGATLSAEPEVVMVSL